MEIINKYISAISDELSKSEKNMDKIVDLFKTTSELYYHTQTNLVNTILYPESTLSIKYPSDWYRPTASFRLTQTYTFQPKNGKFFAVFYPNLLFTESSKATSLRLNLNLGYADNKREMLNTTTFLPEFAGDFGERIAKGIFEKGKNYVKEKLKNSGLNLDFIDKIDGNKDIKEYENIIETALGLVHDEGLEYDVKLNVPDNIIEQYRCNAAVLKIRGEDSQGILLGTTTYFNTSSDNVIKEQESRYKDNYSNFAQEWLYKMEDNPEKGMRIIKTPKDNNDMIFRQLNSRMNSEQVIMIAGKGLNPNSVYVIDVIQHIEFIPVLKMMDFFVPTIPMFSLGSKEQLFKSTSNFPIIGANGSLILNSPANIDKIMEIIKKYKSSGSNLSLWNILTDSSYINDENLLSLINNTFYK